LAGSLSGFPPPTLTPFYNIHSVNRILVTDVAIKAGKENLYTIYTLRSYKEEKI